MIDTPVVLRVTDVRLSLHRDSDSPILAFASVVLEDQLLLHGFRLIRSGTRLVVALPERRGRDGVWRPMVEWLTTRLADDIARAVIQAYQDERARPERRFPGGTG